MKPTDPQFLYMILVLPVLFGFVLVGEGLNKVVHKEMAGFISIFFGIIFLGAVIIAYLFFSTYLSQKI